MDILAISDLHGFLPEIRECDLLLLGGDYCPTRNLDQERRFISGKFTDWLKSLKAKRIVGVAGNHDFILQKDPKLAKDLPWIYLQDEGIEVDGVTIYGSPWTLPFFDWAFMKPEDQLRKVFASIPEGLDILLTHGPSYRHRDKTEEGIYTGSFSLWERIKETKPKVHVFGHIHEARGIMDDAGIGFYNVSHVTRSYEPSFPAAEIQLEYADE